MNQRILKLRKSLDLTMEEFGKKLGVTRSAISNIESGKRNLTEQMIISICREFSVNEEWLRTGNGEMLLEAPASVLDSLAEQYGFSEREYAFIAEFAKLSEKERTVILDFVMNVASRCSAQNPQTSAASTAQLDIDAEVESYRRALELQKKVFVSEKPYDIHAEIPDTPGELEERFPPVDGTNGQNKSGVG